MGCTNKGAEYSDQGGTTSFLASCTIRCTFLQARAKISSHGYKGSDTYLHTAPLSHIGGLVSWLAMLQASLTSCAWQASCLIVDGKYVGIASAVVAVYSRA